MISGYARGILICSAQYMRSYIWRFLSEVGGASCYFLCILYILKSFAVEFWRLPPRETFRVKICKFFIFGQENQSNHWI